MLWAQRLWLRLEALFSRSRAAEQLDDEIKFHLDEQIAENVAAGMNLKEAGRAARRSFGNPTVLKEKTMETWGWIRLQQIGQDLRYGFRTLRKSPLFTAVAVLTLALGIGANAAIFSLLDQVLLQLLPVKHPEMLALVAVRGNSYGGSFGVNDISYPMYQDLRDNNQVFSGMFCRFPISVNLGFGDRPERVAAELVSGSYFPVLGVSAAAGRTITPNDDRIPGGHPVAMLSYSFWQTHFSSDSAVIGKAIVLNGHEMTVIGIVQPEFDGVELGYKTKIFIPIMMKAQMTPYWDGIQDRRRRISWVTAFGRLKPGVSIQQAKASLEPILHSILETEVQEPVFRNYSAYDRRQFLENRIDVLPGSQGWSDLRQQMETPLWVLIALTGAVLLLACANLANLLLARAAAREREMAVRLAIGAGRSRIMRQLLVESLLLSGFGAAMGLGLAFLADHLLLATYLPADTTGAFAISAVPDFQVLAFTLCVMFLTTLIFGLAPAIHSSRANVAPTLKDQAGPVLGGGSVLARKLLVAAQITLSLLLLIGAGLFVRTLRNLQSQGPGFSTERLMAFSLDPSLNGYSDDRAKIFYRQLTEDLKTTPGITSVGLSTMPILEGYGWQNPVIAEGYQAKSGQEQQPVLNEVSPNYFATLGVPILAGRDFTTRDTTLNDLKHAIINESFARKYFAGRNPIGLHIGLVNYESAARSEPGTEVIGVVKDIKYKNLRDAIPVQAYFPYLEGDHFRFMTIYLRTSLDPRQPMTQVRETLRRLDPTLPLVDMRTIDEQIDLSLKSERLVASLATIFGGLATLLAVIGLYGVMAYTVARRTREFGLRVALGALQRDVIWLVMRDVLILIVTGLAVGLPVAFALSNLVRSQLFGLGTHDPLTLISATLTLTVVACLAGLIPAFRASRVDPMQSLRNQ
jgi:predicted permease